MLIVKSEHVNLWSKWRIIITMLGYGISTFVYAIVPFTVVAHNLTIGITTAVIVGVIAATVGLGRNKIVKRLAVGSTFDSIYRLQTRAERMHFLTTASFFVPFFVAVVYVSVVSLLA